MKTGMVDGTERPMFDEAIPRAEHGSVASRRLVVAQKLLRWNADFGYLTSPAVARALAVFRGVLVPVLATSDYATSRAIIAFRIARAHALHDHCVEAMRSSRKHATGIAHASCDHRMAIV